jgi:hypothetical protein
MTHSTGRWLWGGLVMLALLPGGAHAQAAAVQAPEPSVATTFLDFAVAVEPGRRLVLTTIDGAIVRGRF